ncbi:MAG: MoaA/NifB/PqqE/SkfB family radical SAM enzyme [Myxococcota bacterium]|jgi:MoaA/NifB/PqqE/SkfB family radical SAM enzyme
MGRARLIDTQGDLVVDVKTIMRGALARAGVRPAPIAVAFEVTHRCNLACHYCDRHTEKPNEMSWLQIVGAFEELHARGMRYISLDGGEPLTHPRVSDMVDWLVSRGVRTAMNTNGILVPKKLDVIKRLHKVKVSLDGPAKNHDKIRGRNAHRRAIRGAMAARDCGVDVEFTCVVGAHNVDVIDDLLDEVDGTGLSIVFQPARNSLFLGTDRDGSQWQPDAEATRAAFRLIEARKRMSPTLVGNAWASLKHFRRFPDDVRVPCAAGWVEVTLDPEGSFFHCGQLARSPNAPNLVRQGVGPALAAMKLGGCSQCWCARVVEANYRWGGRADMLLPPTLALGSA